MTAAVLAARSRIACGDGFLAIRRFKLSSGAGGPARAPVHPGRLYRWWQEWRDSNPRPSVLETDALPAELHSFSTSIRPVSAGFRNLGPSPRRPRSGG